MGRDKAAVPLDGERMLDRAVRRLSGVFPEVLVVGREAGRDAGALGAKQGVRFLPDEEPGLGPLGGIVTALAAASRPWVFVAACDMPFLDEPLIARLWEIVKGIAKNIVKKSSGPLAVVPRLAGVAQPLAAFYCTRALAPAREALARGELSVTRLLGELDAMYLDVEPGSAGARALADLDTEADLAEAERVIQAGRD